MKYQSIIVIGNGSLLTRCLQWLLRQLVCPVNCVETGASSFSGLPRFCQDNGVHYVAFPAKEQLNNSLGAVSDSTLVLSIHNSVIFTSATLNNRNLRIVNFHNSLLPRHPGRNAPSWAIYEMDEMGGITWHEVIREVDRGDIIAQRGLPITAKMNGIELTRACANLGFECFKEILPSLLADTYVPLRQDEDTHKMHFAREIPNDGILDPDWPVVRMSAFLRALDYGAHSIFEKPRVNCDGQWYVIDKYMIEEGVALRDARPPANDDLIFSDGTKAVRMRVKPFGAR